MNDDTTGDPPNPKHWSIQDWRPTPEYFGAEPQRGPPSSPSQSELPEQTEDEDERWEDEEGPEEREVLFKVEEVGSSKWSILKGLRYEGSQKGLNRVLLFILALTIILVVGILFTAYAL